MEKERTYLKHGQQQVLFSALVLIAVDCKHDRLQQLVDLRHGDEPAKVGDVSGFTLEQEKQIAVLLRSFVVDE